MYPYSNWRVLAFEKDGEKTEIEKEGILDEVVFRDWFHLEQMTDRAWWMRIGDVRVWVSMEEEGKVKVDIERGVYENAYGETTIEPIKE